MDGLSGNTIGDDPGFCIPVVCPLCLRFEGLVDFGASTTLLGSFGVLCKYTSKPYEPYREPDYPFYQSIH